MSLQGTLKTLGITEVLEFLATRRATGQLDVTTEMGTAVYLFSDGTVAQSEYSFIRERGTDAAEATYYVVSELDGTFYFDEDQEPIDVDGCEEVTSVLSRTAEIAEKWLDVEETIPTPTHLLVRNTELDGSVMIQPEWWKALEVIGEGSTSLDVAEKLDMGVLDASLLVLAMTNAGLLNVHELDSLDIDEASLGQVEVAEHYVDADDSLPAESPVLHEESYVEPLTVEPVTIAPESAPESLPVEDVAPAPMTPSFATVSTGLPAPAESVHVDVPRVEVAHIEPAPVVAAEVLHPEVAYLEPQTATEPILAGEPVAEQIVEAAIPQPAPAPVLAEDDGWASDHSRSYDQAAPIEPTPATAVAAVPDLATTQPDFETPTPVVQEFGTTPAEVFEAADPSTTIAGEVLSDLATLSDQLDDTEGQEANWQLDGTFVAQDAPTTPQADSDPFGDLGDLLVDSDDDEDRGSVLKFLRRD